MSSLLIWATQPAEFLRPELRANRHDRGDIVEVQEDGFYWGDAVHGPDALGHWIVAHAPGVPPRALKALAHGDPTDTYGARPRLRSNRLDLDGLLAKCPLQRGPFTVRFFEGLAMTDGKIIEVWQERQVTGSFITVDKETLLAHRYTVNNRGH